MREHVLVRGFETGPVRGVDHCARVVVLTLERRLKYTDHLGNVGNPQRSISIVAVTHDVHHKNHRL